MPWKGEGIATDGKETPEITTNELEMPWKGEGIATQSIALIISPLALEMPWKGEGIATL